jgi:hypothetical protein
LLLVALNPSAPARFLTTDLSSFGICDTTTAAIKPRARKSKQRHHQEAAPSLPTTETIPIVVVVVSIHPRLGRIGNDCFIALNRFP